MQIHSLLRLFGLSIMLAALSTQTYAEEAPAADAPKTFEYPYVGEITASNVYVRSGAGTLYYECGMLNANDRIIIVSSEFGWDRIVPPIGTFSWISKEYVQLDANDPNHGTLTGNNVRVYAGSKRLDPTYSTTSQKKLNTGDTVTLLGEEKEGYYKIAPPEGVYLWIKSDLVNPLGPVDQVPLLVKPVEVPVEQVPVEPETKSTEPNEISTVPSTEPNEPNETEVAAPEQPQAQKQSVEDEKLLQYKNLEEQINAEREKPLAEQDYAEIEKSLQAIATDEQAGKAVRYAEYALMKVKRYQLAISVNETFKLQNENLKNINDQIEKTKAKRLEGVKNLGKFAAIGTLQISTTFGGQDAKIRYFRLTDEKGNTMCYAKPQGKAVSMDLDSFVGKKVGLVGKVEVHTPTGGSLVSFTDIKKID